MKRQFRWNKKTKIFDIIIDGVKVGTSKKTRLSVDEMQKYVEKAEAKVKVEL